MNKNCIVAPIVPNLYNGNKCLTIKTSLYRIDNDDKNDVIRTKFAHLHQLYQIVSIVFVSIVSKFAQY